jgi:predicted flavoprotein YhiN
MKSSYDVLVIGAGVAGVAASIAVAQQGASVLLLERYGVLGGLASHAAVGTVCGAFLRDKDKLLWGCSNFVQEFLSAANLLERSKIKIAKQGQIYIPYKISMFHNYCRDQLLKYQVDIELHSTVCGVKAGSKNIESLNYLSWNRLKQIQFKALVDASGEALSLNLLQAPSLERYLAQAASLSIAAIGFNSGQDERTLNLELARCIELDPELKKLGRLSILPGSIRQNYAELYTRC